MLEEYDIDKLNPRPNPYAKELNKQVTVKIAPSVIEYGCITWTDERPGSSKSPCGS